MDMATSTRLSMPSDSFRSVDHCGVHLISSHLIISRSCKSVLGAPRMIGSAE